MDGGLGAADPFHIEFDGFVGGFRGGGVGFGSHAGGHGQQGDDEQHDNNTTAMHTIKDLF
jgi:hypothetical protein